MPTNPETDRVTALYDAIDAFQREHRTSNGLGHAQIRALLAEHLDRALPAVVSSPPATGRATLMRAHVALAEQAGRDQAALARVHLLHDRLAEETDLTSPDDSITRGAAAKRIAAALDGWNPAGAPQCDVEFEGGGRCAKPVGHRPPGSDDPHVPAVGARQPDTETPCGPEAEAASARVRALHERYRFAGDDTTDYCAHCNQISGGWIPWPCPTLQALAPTAGGAGGVADETGEGDRKELVVGYRSANGDILRCSRHAKLGLVGMELVPVTTEDLPSGGLCTYPGCGADVLIPQGRTS